VHGAGLAGGAGRALAIASARTGAREKVQGHREVLWPAGTLSVASGNFSDSSLFFFDRSRRFPINRGRGGGAGGRVRNFFFFFFAILGGRGGGRGTPNTRGTSCAIPSWNVPKSIFRSRSQRKSVTKGRQRSPKCHRRGGGTKKCVSPHFLNC
jgi:hypothetical protein